jgi:hypothetical protein
VSQFFPSRLGLALRLRSFPQAPNSRLDPCPRPPPQKEILEELKAKKRRTEKSREMQAGQTMTDVQMESERVTRIKRKMTSDEHEMEVMGGWGDGAENLLRVLRRPWSLGGTLRR